VRLVFLNILAAGLVLAVIVVFAAWALRQVEEKRSERAENGRRAQAALDELQGLLARHPDYGFERAALQLESFRRLSLRELASRRTEVEALRTDVELEAASRATGRSPGGEGWQELLQFKTFSPNGFRQFYETLAFPRTRPISEPPAITGDPLADARIVKQATARGYRLRAEAEPEALESYGPFRLQPAALGAFRRLLKQAAAEGIRLEMASGFRSVDRQRAIFLIALNAQGLRRIGRPYRAEELASGAAEAAIEAVLAESAPPGFSRHHTGYTLDLNDSSTGRDFIEFAGSPAYRWLSAADFLQAKRFGFIPSYPAGATAQGPDPEPWEYAWVGEELLRAAPAERP
jgi:D-alanyl-D-alanine carboxypeptidase